MGYIKLNNNSAQGYAYLFLINKKKCNYKYEEKVLFLCTK